MVMFITQINDSSRVFLSDDGHQKRVIPIWTSCFLWRTNSVPRDLRDKKDIHRKSYEMTSCFSCVIFVYPMLVTDTKSTADKERKDTYNFKVENDTHLSLDRKCVTKIVSLIILPWRRVKNVIFDFILVSFYFFFLGRLVIQT